MTRKTVAGALLLIATLGAIALTAILETRRQQPSYAMPMTVVLIAGLCVALTATGGVIAMRAGQLSPWLAPVATFVLVFAFLLAGTLIVAPIVLLMVLVAFRVQSGQQWARGLCVSASVLLTLGLVPLGLMALSPPVVECFPDGVSSAIPIWTWFVSGFSLRTTAVQGASSSSSVPQRSSGAITTGGVTYTYTCDGQQLVQFTSG